MSAHTRLIPQVAIPSDKNRRERPETASNASYRITDVGSVPKHYEVQRDISCPLEPELPPSTLFMAPKCVIYQPS